jgi:hypothetical protein
MVNLSSFVHYLFLVFFDGILIRIYYQNKSNRRSTNHQLVDTLSTLCKQTDSLDNRSSLQHE